MLHKYTPVENIRGLLEPLRKLMERHLYTGVTLAPEAAQELFNIFILIDDQLAAHGHDCAVRHVTLHQLEAVARDLGMVDAADGAARAASVPRATSATVLPFRLPPRPIYEPAGPGGAA
ncbi:hypothetical protein [Ancylobacter pratisalsi]|uniref:Uncharacterized protein n=1 Tax=Ancylobacter pratisalsi TaxID=1745854 RepID=A0A6P1YPE2_9HYPH|nr:hypothetical protein [Ancylobacter pratisalsi]QIB34780.1 hypothetical protein G3A50_14480 [Ancylobacter pratisalsi]